MYSVKNIDGKDSNTTKGVNITTEFFELKDTLFNKIVHKQKMIRIQGKKHKTWNIRNQQNLIIIF